MNENARLDMAMAQMAGTHYDESEKSLWRHKELIAPVLKFVVRELKDYTVDEIIGFIDNTTITREQFVSPVPETVDIVNAELSSTVEKLLRFDVKFCIVNPALEKTRDGKAHKLHVDFEPQHDYYPSNPGYPIVKRGLYYAARDLSSQLSSVTKETNYAALEKVVSIWVCNFGVPSAYVNTVSKYFIQKEDIIGIVNEKTEHYDLMECIIIRRDDAVPFEKGDNVFDYLQAVYTGDVNRVNHYVDTADKPEIRREVRKMTYSEARFVQGFERGIEQGIRQAKNEERENITVKLAQEVINKNLNIDTAARIVDLSTDEFIDKAYLLGFNLKE